MLPLRVICRRYRAWILITVVLLLCQSLWLRNGRIERIFTVPEGYQFLRMQNSTVYLRKSIKTMIDWSRDLHYVRRPGHTRLVPMLTSSPAREQDLSPLFAMPVTGGAMREVPFNSLEAEETEQLITAGTDSYRIEVRNGSRLPGLFPPMPAGKSPGANTGGASSSPALAPLALIPSSRLPSSRLPSSRLPSSLTATALLPRTLVYRMDADQRTILLHPVSPSAHSASAALTYPMGYIPRSTYLFGPGSSLPQRIAVSGDSLYWVSVFPDERVERVERDGKSIGAPVYRYKTAVMGARVPGGAAQKLLEGLPDTAFLLPCEDGVLCWKGDTLWRLRIDRGPQRLIAGITPVYVSEWSGHLFWAETQNGGNVPYTRLMQANADGSNPRLLLQTPQYLGDFDFMRYGTSHARPRTYHGHLYCLLVERDTHYPDSAGTPVLYRLKTSPTPILERLCALPQETRRCWFDDAFLYCLTFEDGLSEFSLRTDSKPSMPRNVFYRYRLPK